MYVQTYIHTLQYPDTMYACMYVYVCWYPEKVTKQGEAVCI